MGNVLAHHGQRACPCWADLLSDKCPKVNVVIPIFLFSGFSRLLQFLSAEFLTSDKSFHLTITFISKPSRQLPDNRQTANHLVIRILQPKTRQSDVFLHFWGNMTFEVNWGCNGEWVFPLFRTKVPHLAIFVVLLYRNQENYNDTRYFYILRLDRWLMWLWP